MRLRRQALPRPGSAAVEFAIVSIPLLILLAGVWEVGRIIEAHNVITNAAREGGRQASTGTKSATDVQNAILTYLARNNINSTGMTYTLENLTQPSKTDPRDADQLDRFRLVMSIPYGNVRWALIPQITSTTNMSVTVYWYSMKDIPLDVSGDVPVE
jgi:Flp pilus assembly protein TadG